MKRVFRSIVIFYFGLGLVAWFAPAIYWFMNPKMTYMEVFIEFWPVMLLGIVCTVISLWAFEQLKG